MRLILTISFTLFFLVGKAQSIADFELTDQVSGKQFKLSNHQNKKGVVVIFFSNDCPYTIHYVDRINHLQQTFKSSGVEFVLINSNSDEYSPGESVDKMKKIASEYGLNLPYLSDKDQHVRNILGAKRTPQAFLLQPGSAGFTVVYQGAIDDNPQVETDVYHHYLNDAILSLLSGKPITQKMVRPTGCLIK